MKNILGKLMSAGFALASGLAMAAPCGGGGQAPCDVPEPGSLPLVVIGLVGAVAVRAYLKNRRK